MELVAKNINEIITSDYVDLLLQMQELETRIKFMDSALNDEIKNYLIDNDLMNIELEKDGIKLKWTYVKPTTTRKVDYEQLQVDGLYDKYVTESQKKDFVRRTISYEDTDE